MKPEFMVAVIMALVFVGWVAVFILAALAMWGSWFI